MTWNTLQNAVLLPKILHDHTQVVANRETKTHPITITQAFANTLTTFHAKAMKKKVEGFSMWMGMTSGTFAPKFNEQPIMSQTLRHSNTTFLAEVFADKTLIISQKQNETVSVLPHPLLCTTPSEDLLVSLLADPDIQKQCDPSWEHKNLWWSNASDDENLDWNCCNLLDTITQGALQRNPLNHLARSGYTTHLDTRQWMSPTFVVNPKNGLIEHSHHLKGHTLPENVPGEFWCDILSFASQDPRFDLQAFQSLWTKKRVALCSRKKVLHLCPGWIAQKHETSPPRNGHEAATRKQWENGFFNVHPKWKKNGKKHHPCLRNLLTPAP